MGAKLDDSKPIFIQIAEEVESGILDDTFPEGSRVPSTNEFAAHYQINPATAAKGINLLVDEGILYKKRGIGMFVSEGAKKQVTDKRKTQFYESFIVPLMNEAAKLDISPVELETMIKKGGRES
ncbi:GntR family transcriptional regulator [Domibacillus epiphyticus]|uniref:GntR family transcriptional regulator n=1 Tax=Domibacillus epiphyticus TaxID=1714355 RepID=A0A1V2AAY4_9BACI|nr:GntR family transcriptional regulator [Domibacillus epiphyticus]OMP68120.1 GntR family transcriptional regulator [Domibacillus epiphyticus]